MRTLVTTLFAASALALTSPSHADEASPRPALLFTGYLQAQYEAHQDSQNQVQQGGALLNQNRFVLRRARLRATHTAEMAEGAFEVDANTVNGATLNVRRAEATIFWPPKEKDAPRLVAASIGVFDLPFGHELVEPPRTRHFAERSTVSRALFPSEPDAGAKLSGGIGFFRYALAVVNGEPIDERSGFGARDPNATKDLVARFGFERTMGRVFAAGGVSWTRGKGFHLGTQATKDALQWRDLNEDGQVQPNEILAVPGTAATPSASFSRWAVGVDARAEIVTPLGRTRVFAEAVWAQNMDRGLYVADPIASSLDIRERGWVVGVTQEILPFSIVGFRMDFYDPNADSQTKKLGKLVPASAELRTYSPLVGLVLPGRAKLLFQIDFIRDHLGRTGFGVPVDLRNDTSTVRLQVDL